MRNTLNYICYGPSVAPCTFVNGSYQVCTYSYLCNYIPIIIINELCTYVNRPLECGWKYIAICKLQLVFLMKV